MIFSYTTITDDEISWIMYSGKKRVQAEGNADTLELCREQMTEAKIEIKDRIAATEKRKLKAAANKKKKGK